MLQSGKALEYSNIGTEYVADWQIHILLLEYLSVFWWYWNDWDTYKRKSSSRDFWLEMRHATVEQFLYALCPENATLVVDWKAMHLP